MLLLHQICKYYDYYKTILYIVLHILHKNKDKQITFKSMREFYSNFAQIFKSNNRTI